MEPPKSETPKLSDMVMCGDHPSFTKTELNVKEAKPGDENKDKEKAKEKIPMSYAKISPQSSRTAVEQRVRAGSEHALRLAEARRRVRSLEAAGRPEPPAPSQGVGPVTGNRALLQAALGSFRWPPYLLAVWVLVLVITHVLHCLVSVLERALPGIQKFCLYFRTWTEDSWKSDSELNHRVYHVGLACLTALLYALYFSLYAVYSIALWSIEPLCSENEDKRTTEDGESKMVDYVEDVNSKTNSSLKQ